MLIGKLIPAGTGMRRYRSIKLDTELEEDEAIMLSDEEDLDEAALDEVDKIILNEDELQEE